MIFSIRGGATTTIAISQDMISHGAISHDMNSHGMISHGAISHDMISHGLTRRRFAVAGKHAG